MPDAARTGLPAARPSGPSEPRLHLSTDFLRSRSPGGLAQNAPGWLRLLIAYLVSRLVTSVILAIVLRTAHPGSHLGRHAELSQVITAWDGQWYQLVAEAGYPTHPPTYAGGVSQNTWAFLPL